jgi:hypothetical protein
LGRKGAFTAEYAKDAKKQRKEVLRLEGTATVDDSTVA